MLDDPDRFAFATRRHHAFATTGNAYDAVQTDDQIRNGDTLVVLAERVIGVARTWPFVVTAEAGKLHQIDGSEPDDTLDGVASDLEVEPQDIRHALALAVQLGFEIDPSLARFAAQ